MSTRSLLTLALPCVLLIACQPPAPPSASAPAVTIAADPVPTSAPAAPVAAPAPAPAPAPRRVEAAWQGKEFHAGDRVRIASRAGTFKPKDTHHPEEIGAGPGQVGTVVRGEKRQATSYFKPDPNEPIQIVRVTFDAQNWEDQTTGRNVRLGVFDATLHVEYLEVIP